MSVPPTGGWCNAGATFETDDIAWEPLYEDECQIEFKPPLRDSSYSVSMDAASLPTVSTTKTCTVNGAPVPEDGINPIFSADLNIVCTMEVEYDYPAGCPATPLSVTDTFPTDTANDPDLWAWQVGTFTASQLPQGRSVDTTTGEIRWTIPAEQLNGSGTIRYTQEFTVTAAQSNAIATSCIDEWTNTFDVDGSDCCGCMRIDESSDVVIPIARPEVTVEKTCSPWGLGVRAVQCRSNPSPARLRSTTTTRTAIQPTI